MNVKRISQYDHIQNQGRPSFRNSAARGLKILQTFKSGEERLSNLDIAQRCGLPKSTVTRLTHTLTILGFLHHLQESGRYRLGLATLTLGKTTRERLDLHLATGTLLQEVANKTKTMVSLTIQDELSILYIESFRSQSSVITIHVDIGSRLPPASTAAGRAHLVASPEAVRQSLMERIQRLDPLRFLAIDKVFLQAIDDFATYGCVTSFGEWREEINAIAVPMALGPDLPLIVANAAALVGVISRETFMSDVRRQLITMVHAIENRYRPASPGVRARNL